MSTETIWLGIGFLGQGLFFGRWLVQWIASERSAESRVPISFWYMSLIGGLITLTYAIYRKDPVFISGQGLGAVVYLRNLVLISRADQTKSQPGPQS
ncbi:MAG: lipid-A-disaccharide synthase N-terminal domain-containing protein [Nitrospira sp.]